MKCEDCYRVEASYGMDRATHCASCRRLRTNPLPRNFRSRMCISCGTREAIYGNARETTRPPQRCSSCAIPGQDINVKHPRCDVLECQTFVRQKGQVCARCRDDAQLTPRRYEHMLAQWLTSNGIDYTSHNACPGPSTRYRPDFVLSRHDDTSVVIIECDENQHRGYDWETERVREQRITRCFPDKTVVFIRFCPAGSFKTLRGITKCPRWCSRLVELRRVIETPSKESTVTFLFYDDDHRRRFSDG